MKLKPIEAYAALSVVLGALALVMLHALLRSNVTVGGSPIAACTREHDMVKVTLKTARSLSRRHADSEPFQYKAAGQMETMFRVCFADPDRDSPESPGLLAATLGDLTEDEIAHVEKVLDDGWAKSTIGQPWRGEVR